MSDAIRPNPSSDESRLPAVFRKRRSEGDARAENVQVPRRGAFEQMLGEELGSVGRMGPASEAGEASVESLLISRNLGNIYRSFLDMDS